MRHSHPPALVGCIVAIVAAARADDLRFTLTDLGHVPGYRITQAYGLNRFGHAVLTAEYPFDSRDPEYQTFWHDGSALRPLFPSKATLASAHGINDLDQVAGTIGHERAFVWQASQMRKLEPLAGGSASWSFAINNAGQVAGGSYLDEQGLQYHAVRWEVDGTATDLGARPERWSNGLVINERGHVVGYAAAEDYRAFAALWRDGEMIELATPGGRHSAFALGINDHDEAVGVSYGRDSVRAVWWSRGQVAELQTPDAFRSGANAINIAGAIVGYIQAEGQRARATLWRGGKRYDLTDLLVPLGDWAVVNALDINESGWIVGTALHDGKYHGVLLKPVPEPVTAFLTSPGVLVLLRRARCHLAWG